MPAKINLPDKTCKQCGNTFNRYVFKSGRLEDVKDYVVRKFCSHKCFSFFNIGENHSLFKKEGSKRHDGYIRYANNGKREYLHRVIMEQKIGRKLLPNEDVHHINNNPSDNRLENLELIEHSDHLKLHSKQRKRNKIGRFIL